MHIELFVAAAAAVAATVCSRRINKMMLAKMEMSSTSEKGVSLS